MGISALLMACGADAGPPAPAEPVIDVPAVEPPTLAPPIANRLAASIDAILTAAAARDAFAGSVIVVDLGQTVFEKGYGFAERAGVKRMNAPDTIYRIGSISRQFTAAAILALVSEQKVSLADPVSKWFPELPREGVGRDGVEATVHHLLTDTSGLGDGFTTSFYRNNAWRRPMRPDDVVAAARGLPLVEMPGTTVATLDYGYLLLARIVEKASGAPYETFLRDRFWARLGMTDTGTILPVIARDRAATGYEKAGMELTALADQPAFGDPDCTLAFGSGQIYSTVRDLALWDRALASGTALSRIEVDRFFEPLVGQRAYGGIVEQNGGVVVEYHKGALNPLGFTSYIARVPAKDRFVALLTNLDRDAIAPLEDKVAALSADVSKRAAKQGVTYTGASR